MAVPGKQYGLILPQKKILLKAKSLQKHCVFGDDSDDETSVGESLQKEAAKKKTMRQTQLEMTKALEQDSTVYDYDAVYDNIQQQRLENSKKVLSGAEKRPKYIHQLMKAVENRKKEQERRDERKIQKEREAEGEQFADKEAYVTTAYKLKLQEQKEEAEREKRQAAIEAALDVRKQKDLSGFYRHLLNQTVGEEAIPDRSANKSQSLGDIKVEEASQASGDNTPSPGSDGEDAREEKHGFNKPSKRHYRHRSPSSGSDDQRERDRRKKREREKDERGGWRRDEDRDGRRSHTSRRDSEREERRKEGSGREREGERKERKNSEKDKRKERGERKTKEEEKERKEEEKERKEEEKERKENEKERNEGEKEIKDEKEIKEDEKEIKEDEEEIKEDEKEIKEDEEERKQDADKKEEEKVSKFAKRSNEQTLSSARDRYLARQMARSASKSYIEREED
ncbi:nuclear speckle splicing regulatory protein 1 [Nerophis ophidion]|uniref:nuclear speckle splicing regulatory protein 1 n=1 Tax=Nerophis ophidion TaxID=159077 RepID=UPI002ADFB625|nr:nuclear speckle splicing regulatory protein 1 [Nerophis ophidion]XP_061755096.1 nuclear speckle splicing regulatory protein 1 [Nerophis ophidion]